MRVTSLNPKPFALTRLCSGKEDDPQATEGASARDCYAIIGVDSSAEKSDIKRAYRKLALKYHPGVHSPPHVSY